MSVKAGLAPIARSNAQLFILGSLPGDASLAAGRYYAHPSNQFWRLLGGAINEELQDLEYGERLLILARRRIGLWDVIASAARRGSLDKFIRGAAHNRIEHLLTEFPSLQAIAFNGATASAAGRKLIGERASRLVLVDLPSSSAANTVSIETKASRWAELGPFAHPQEPRTCATRPWRHD